MEQWEISTAADLRRYWEQGLGCPLAATTWQYLQDHGEVNDVLAMGDDPEVVVRQLRALAPTWTGAARTRRAPQQDEDAWGETLVAPVRDLEARRDALEAWAAQVARRDPLVENFRRRAVTPLLRPAEVNDWLDRHQDASIDPRRGVRFGQRLPSNRTSTLRVLVPESTTAWTVRTLSAPHRSVFALLAEISAVLAGELRWMPEAAALFVLTDEEPSVPSIRARFRHVVGVGDGNGIRTATDPARRDQYNKNAARTLDRLDLPPLLVRQYLQTRTTDERSTVEFDAYSNVEIDLDPYVSPGQLADWWRHARRGHVPGELDDNGRRVQRRMRAMGERRLRLAAFIARCPADMTWEQRRVAWNSQVPPEWQYDKSNRSNFGAVARGAVRRLLNVGYR